MKKNICFLLVSTLCLSLVLGFSFVGCKTTTSVASETTVAETTAAAGTVAAWEGKTIGLSVPDVAWPWVTSYVDWYKKYAQENNMNVIVYGAGGDEAKQVKDMEDLITKKVDIISVFPAGPTSIVQPIKKAYDSGIPVLLAVNIADPEAYDYIIGYSGQDSVYFAKKAARVLAAKLNNEGNIVILSGYPGQPDEVAKSTYFPEELAKVAPNIKILDKQRYDWDPAKAKTVMEDFIVKYPDIKGIYIMDDGGGAAICDVLASHGFKAGDIFIISTAGSAAGIAKVKEGWLETFDLNTEINAGLDFNVITNYFAGKPYPFQSIMPQPLLTKETCPPDYKGSW